MSWSKGAKGTAAAIIEQLAGLVGEVDAIDKKYGASEELRAGHRRQTNAALGAVVEFVKEEPAGREFEVSASGHANGDGTGNVYVSIHEHLAKAEPASGNTGADDVVGAQNGNGKHSDAGEGSETGEEIPDAGGASGVAEKVTEGEGPTNPEDLAPVGG